MCGPGGKETRRHERCAAAVNFATEKATVTAPPSVSVDLLIEAVEQAGYGAELARPLPRSGPAAAGGAGPDADRVAYLRRRLIVALVFFVPLSDLSVLLSLFPAFRFPGWQWVLVALAAPVAGWAAWPFHAAALKNARHGSASMDTLVSLGIAAACGWSVYAMFVLDARPARVSALQLLIHASGGGIYLEVAASVTTFLLAGRWYEARARRDAGDAMRELAAAGARDACVLDADGTERRVPAAQLRPGDRFVTRPGETIAADGVVEFGESAVDTSMMTGESVPAEAAAGDRGDRGHCRGQRPAGHRGRPHRRRHAAGAPDRPGRPGAGGQVSSPAARRPDLRRVRPGGAGGRGADPGRLAPGGRAAPNGAFSAAPGRADHRLPVRAGAGDPGRPGRRVRAGRAAGHLHQGLSGPGGLPQRRHRAAGQDRDHHHRGHGGDRRPARGRHQPGGSCSGISARSRMPPGTRSRSAVSSVRAHGAGQLPRGGRTSRRCPASASAALSTAPG